MDLQHVKGIGESSISSFYKANIYSVEDLISFYPYRYQILKPEVLENTNPEMTITINATVCELPKICYIRRNLNCLKFKCMSYGKLISVTIFNRSFLKSKIVIGKDVTLIGKYNSKNNQFIASDMKLSKLEGTKIIPVYHLIKGIKNTTLIKIINNALHEITEYEEIIPQQLRLQKKFLTKRECLFEIHNPTDINLLNKARQSLIYEELFEFMFQIQYLKALKEQEVGLSKEVDEEKIENFISTLPFTLTKDQKKGIEEGLNDLKTTKRMNRLLLGDVGSGKTIVATVFMYANFLAGYQSAFMAPTEILATQHFYSIRSFFKNINISIDLFVGSMTKKEKNNILKRVQNHEIDILIGTHAMLNENLFFDNLGLIITDEQHRFGVNQRNLLKEKGNLPDMLFMSATPIPRTYALTIYGDMDTTMLKEKPNGRKEIITKVVKESNLKEVLLKILEEIKLGHQVYVVAPMIEENDTNLKDVNLLKEKFDLAYHNKVPIGVLHGKMKKADKEAIMNDFKVGSFKILISTTVIEVGVDNPNATVMVIFNAERFGLATLHQLRGRVGRNDLQSYCYLICNEEKERLKVLENSNDGFYISEKDFEFRGEGDLFGMKQSGEMTFKIANLKRDYEVLLDAKKEATKYLESKDYRQNIHYQKIIEKLDFTN